MSTTLELTLQPSLITLEVGIASIPVAEVPPNPLVRSVRFDMANPIPVTQPGEATWNPAERTLDVNLGNGVIGQLFKEAHIDVYNDTGAALVDGDVVGFAGVNSTEAMPKAAKIAATHDFQPLYLIGVVTEPIAPGASGAVTLLGKVRGMNTTGAAVGETWSLAQPLLYLHPEIPGRLTNVEPAPPHPSIPVAALLRVGASDGVLLVRPSIPQRLFFGSFSSSVSQTAALINTAYPITLNHSDIEAGVVRDTVNTSRLKVLRAGLYNVQFSLQVTKSSSSQGFIYIWPKINGQPVANTATKVAIDGNGTCIVPAWNFLFSLNKDDYVELFWSVTDTSISLLAAPANANPLLWPATPSAIVSVTQANQ
jgi:hypothetical protein